MNWLMSRDMGEKTLDSNAESSQVTTVKPWQKPEMTTLSIRGTKGGANLRDKENPHWRPPGVS